MLDGLRGEDSIAELCRREGIVQNLYYRWSKEFLEAGKKRLAGDTVRGRRADEVKDLRRQAGALKEVVAELTLENRLLKKSMIGDGGDDRMRYPASEKLEIIRLVEQSHLPVRRTLDKLGIPRATFYRWYDLLPERWAGGFAGSIATTEAGLEQDPGRGPQPYPHPGPGGPGAVTARAGGALHRHRTATSYRRPRSIACSRRMT